ncbi:hypothetical protein [Pontibacter pamirensis]|uniref:hypothetical protein n=1 Tax=Pontibacter pamirensis TaxID=2562824 RepID=UPI001389A005|nr:hypothetical protein [Pontibacter pamirensis]
MEKEHSEGFGSLLLLLLALFVIICCLELGSTGNSTTAAKAGAQEEFIPVPDSPATAAPASAKVALKQRLIL